MLEVSEENILIKLEAETKEEVIRILVDLLVKNAYLKTGYYDVVVEREVKYPTGLPTEGIKVAIPHGFSEDCVLKPAVGIATLARPVIFNNMFADDEELAVELVFLLALTNKEEQGKDLTRIMDVLSDSKLLCAIHAAKTGSEIKKLVYSSLSSI